MVYRKIASSIDNGHLELLVAGLVLPKSREERIGSYMASLYFFREHHTAIQQLRRRNPKITREEVEDEIRGFRAYSANLVGARQAAQRDIVAYLHAFGRQILEDCPERLIEFSCSGSWSHSDEDHRNYAGQLAYCSDPVEVYMDLPFRFAVAPSPLPVENVGGVLHFDTNHIVREGQQHYLAAFGMQDPRKRSLGIFLDVLFPQVAVFVGVDSLEGVNEKEIATAFHEKLVRRSGIRIIDYRDESPLYGR